jgi:hypothetical protein
MSGTARAKKRVPTIQERIAQLTAKAAALKKRSDLKETIAHARKELQALRGKK